MIRNVCSAYIFFNHLDCGIYQSQVQRKMIAITTAISNLEECASQTKKQTNITRSNYAVTGSETKNLVTENGENNYYLSVKKQNN